jgi:hypothetical protein
VFASASASFLIDIMCVVHSREDDPLLDRQFERTACERRPAQKHQVDPANTRYLSTRSSAFTGTPQLTRCPSTSASTSISTAEPTDMPTCWRVFAGSTTRPSRVAPRHPSRARSNRRWTPSGNSAYCANLHTVRDARLMSDSKGGIVPGRSTAVRWRAPDVLAKKSLWSAAVGEEYGSYLSAGAVANASAVLLAARAFDRRLLRRG